MPRLTAPLIKSRDEAIRFISELSETDDRAPCCYGHLGCSTTEHGPCFDETLSNFPELLEE